MLLDFEVISYEAQKEVLHRSWTMWTLEVEVGDTFAEHIMVLQNHIFLGGISLMKILHKLPENLYRFWSKQNDEDEALCNFAEHIMVLQNHICFGGIALTKILHKVPVTYGETLLEVHNSKHHSSTWTWFTPFTSNSHLKFHIFPWKYMSWAFHIYRRNVKSHQGSKIMIFQN